MLPTEQKTMSLGPLPELEYHPYEEGDIVVYDGFVFEVKYVDAGDVTIENTERVETVPENFISLL